MYRLPAATRLRCRLICPARNSNHAALYAAKWHDGQITQNLSRPLAKNIPLSLSGKSVVLVCPSHPMRGALRTSRTRGGMRWTQKARETHAPGAYGEVAWFGRRGAGAKLAIRSAGDGGKRAVLREEREVSRKAIAQGRPGCFRRTCMLVCTFAICIGTRDRGCGVHPVFPAPSSRGGQRNVQTSGERCREIAKACPTRCRRCSARVPWAATVGHRPAAGRCAGGTSRPVPLHRQVNVARAKGDRIW